MKRAALVLLAGCDAAFGLQHVDPRADAAVAPDARVAPSIAGTIDQLVVGNDPSNTPKIVPRLLPAGNTLIFVADETTGLGTQVAYDDATGSFTVPAGTGDRTRVQLRFGTLIVEYQWNLPVLHAELVTFGRLDAEIAGANTTLVGTYQPAKSPTADVFSTGIFQSEPVMPQLAMYSVDLSAGFLESGSKYDQLIFAAYDSDAASNQVIDERQIVSNYDVSPGVANTVNVTLAALPPDTCIHASTNLGADAARMGMLSTAFDTEPVASNLIVYALPSPTLGGGVQWIVGNTPGAVEDATINVNSTTFPHFTVFPTTVLSRTRMLPNGVSFGINMLHYETLAGPTCAVTTAFPVIAVAFPSAYLLDGVALTSDIATVHLATPTVQLAWTANGPADLYLVQIYDASLNRYLSHSIYTTAAHATLDAKELDVGHAYVFVITSQLGLPNVANGDLTTHAYPFETSISISSVVTVQ